MIERLLLLGAVGDLATRHTLPALAHLSAAGRLAPGTDVVGIGREPLTDDDYRALAGRALEAHAPAVPAPVRAGLLQRLSYVQADLAQGADLRRALGPGRPVIAYLALPPAVYAPAVRALGAAGIPAGSRIIVEKPFGQDLATARALTGLLHTAFDEQDVFRVDHFLYHQAIQDLVALRASPVFAPLWNADHVERVEVVWEEAATVAGRAEFYDAVGALRDMVQSHLLQVLALVAMEPPGAWGRAGLRDAKAAALRSLQTPGPEDLATHSVRARYTAGTVDGRPQRAYADEHGVDPSRGTETYAAVRLAVDTPRWRGVPFVLRTGKALGRGRRRVDVVFRSRSSGGLGPSGAVLSVEMSPDLVELRVSGAGAPGLPELAPLQLTAARPRQSLPASARLIADVLSGDPTHCVRDDETEQSWRVVDAVLAGWRTGAPPLQEYAAGSDGPHVDVTGGRATAPLAGRLR